MELCIICTREGNVSAAISQVLGKKVNTDKTTKGIPFLRGDDHCVSLSHKDSRMAVALSDRKVGVDIERIEDRDSHYRIAATYFGETVPDGDCIAFFRAWTRREAYGKLLGVGLTPQIMRLDLGADSLDTPEGRVYFVEKRVDEYMITTASYYPDGELILIGGRENEE